MTMEAVRRVVGKRKQDPSNPKSGPAALLRPINPRFEGRLTSILDGIGWSRNNIQGGVERARTHVGELQDFISFEIEKTELEVKQLEWESRPDPERLAKAKAWLESLERIRDQFPVNALNASVDFLHGLRDIVKTTFYERGGD